MASINEKVRRGEDQGSRTGRKDKIRKGARRLCFTLKRIRLKTHPWICSTKCHPLMALYHFAAEILAPRSSVVASIAPSG
jgi:hypothetical protein